MICVSDRQMAVELIDEAVANGARQKKACEVAGITARTLQRWRYNKDGVDGRTTAIKVPRNRLSEEEREEILYVCNQEEYQSLPSSQIVPRLADEGIYIASESTFYRVLKSAGQLHHRGPKREGRPSQPPKGHCANGPNQVWSWDITYLQSAVAGLYYYLYLIIDVYSRKIVGWEVHNVENSELSSELIKKTCLSEEVCKLDKPPVLHSDNGGPMKGAKMIATLQKLGVVPSFSRPSVSNDNPFSESLFGTLKSGPKWPKKPFDSLEDAQQWVLEFVTWYNFEHRHSGIRFVTPNQRHQGEDGVILERRKALYEKAKKAHPERWTGKIRCWQPVAEVWLNPPADKNTGLTEAQAA